MLVDVLDVEVIRTKIEHIALVVLLDVFLCAEGVQDAFPSPEKTLEIGSLILERRRHEVLVRVLSH